MGDEVNLGSRLEGVNKEYGTQIIISEATWEYIKERLATRELDVIRVKGKTHPTAGEEHGTKEQPERSLRCALGPSLATPPCTGWQQPERRVRLAVLAVEPEGYPQTQHGQE